MNHEELVNRFTYHYSNNKVIIKAHDRVRNEGFELAMMINCHIGDCDEKTMALHKIEEAVMWANAAIARGNCLDGKTNEQES